MDRKYSVNTQIKAKQINLVLSDGTMKESVPLPQALTIAEEEGLDVVEVANNGKNGLPVCKVMDYGKLTYQQNKKKKRQIQHVKEIRYNFNIDQHDLDTKHKQIFKFLSKHYSVRYVLELSGRQKYMVREALKKINDNLENFKDVASWKEPKVSKNRRVSLSTTLSPL